jgi:CheY-like chemotaxis protein
MKFEPIHCPRILLIDDDRDTHELLRRMLSKSVALSGEAYSRGSLSWQQMVSELGHLDRIVILNKPFKKIEVVQLAVALTAKWQIKQQSKLRVHSLEKLLHSLGSR